MTIEAAKQAAQAGFDKAQQDIQYAQQAHTEAAARLNYFKGAYEVLCQLESETTPPPALDPDHADQ